MTSREKHQMLTAIRTTAYEELFGCAPAVVFPSSALFKMPDEQFLIDIFVYAQETQWGSIEVAVTNGMSDQRMAEADDASACLRRELIQYFPKCTEGHAGRLYDMAWLPLFDRFYLDSHHSIAWEHPAIAGTPWNNAFFLAPLIKSHREFMFQIERDKASFLWHIPISDEERQFKLERGADALVERMGTVELPWIFDESNRPSLVDQMS